MEGISHDWKQFNRMGTRFDDDSSEKQTKIQEKLSFCLQYKEWWQEAPPWITEMLRNNE